MHRGEKSKLLMPFEKALDGQIRLFCIFSNGGGGVVVNFNWIDGSPFSFLIGQNFLTMVRLDWTKHQSLWELMFPIFRNST